MTALLRGWNRFWFLPVPSSTLAVVRIAYGAVLLAWAVSLAWDLPAFFSSSGLVPERSVTPWTWTLLDSEISDTGLAVLLVALIVAAGSLLVGLHPRAAALVAFVLLVSFQRRNPLISNSGDVLLRVFGFYLMFAPTGAALSLDRWRQDRANFWKFPPVAPWVLRLMQVQLCAVYLFSVWEKAQGDRWNEGTAISYALRIDDLVRVPAPGWILESLPIINLMTYGTMALELILVFLVWNHRARPWVLMLGVLMHLSIEATMQIGFFSSVMLVGYLAFIPADTMTKGLLRMRARLERSNLAFLRRVGSPGLETLPPSERRNRREAPASAESS